MGHPVGCSPSHQQQTKSNPLFTFNIINLLVKFAIEPTCNFCVILKKKCEKNISLKDFVIFAF